MKDVTLAAGTMVCSTLVHHCAGMLSQSQLTVRATHGDALHCSTDGHVAVMGSAKVLVYHFRPAPETQSLFDCGWISVESTAADAAPRQQTKHQGFEAVVDWLAARSSQPKVCFTAMRWSAPQRQWGLPSILATTTSHGHTYLAHVDPQASATSMESDDIHARVTCCGLRLLGDVAVPLQAWGGGFVRAVEWLGRTCLAVADDKLRVTLWNLAYDEAHDKLSINFVASLDLRATAVRDDGLGLLDDRKLQCFAFEESMHLLAVGDSAGNVSLMQITSNGEQRHVSGARILQKDAPSGLRDVQHIVLQPAPEANGQGFIVAGDGQNVTVGRWTSVGHGDAQQLHLERAQKVEHPHTHRFYLSSPLYSNFVLPSEDAGLSRWYSAGLDGRILAWTLKPDGDADGMHVELRDLRSSMRQDKYEMARQFPCAGFHFLGPGEMLLAVAPLLPGTKENSKEIQMNRTLEQARLRFDVVAGPQCHWWTSGGLVRETLQALRTHIPSSLAAVPLSVLAGISSQPDEKDDDVSDSDALPGDWTSVLALFRQHAVEDGHTDHSSQFVQWWRRSLGMIVYHLLGCTLPEFVGGGSVVPATHTADMAELRSTLLRTYAAVFLGSQANTAPQATKESVQQLMAAFDGSLALQDQCPICSSSILLDREQPLFAVCENGHSFERCMYSFVLIDPLQADGKVYQCPVCQCCAAGQHMKHVECLSGLCLFCSVPLVRIF